MNEYAKSLRLSIAILSAFLAITGFRIAGMDINWVAIVAVLFVTSVTMVQNDWRDRVHDAQKGKTLALNHEKAFLIWLIACWVACAIFITIATIQNSGVGLVLIILAFIALVYSETRRIPLVPIVLVVLASAAPAAMPIAAGVDSMRVWLLVFSAAFTIFGREITKDIDDVSIDPGYKWTIPLAVGVKYSRAVAAIAITLGLVLAVKLSWAALPGAFVAVLGAIIVVRGVNLLTARRCLDVGMAAILFSLIIFR